MSCAVFWWAPVGQVKIQTMSKDTQRYYTTKRLIRDLLSNTPNCYFSAGEFSGGDSVLQEVRSTGRHMLVRFYSDSESGELHTGFKASFKAISGKLWLARHMRLNFLVNFVEFLSHGLSGSLVLGLLVEHEKRELMKVLGGYFSSSSSLRILN